MNKIGLDDYLKKCSVKKLFKLPRYTLKSKIFSGFEEWYQGWRAKKYDSAAYIAISTAETKWLTARQLVESEDEKADWVWDGLIGLGMITILSARPKCGKSTLLFEGLKAFLNEEPFLGFDTKSPEKVLLLTEEPLSLVKKRFIRLGINGENVFVIPKFKMRNWNETIAYVKHFTENENVKLVIIDTVSAFWNVENENDASNIKDTINPIQEVVRKNNAGLLLIHHLRKSDGEDGRAIRGSGQLFAIVEVGIELNKMPHGGNRRQFNSQGRYEESNQEIAIAFTPERGYQSLGSVDSVKFEEVKKRLLEIIPQEGQEPVSEEDLRNSLDPKPYKTTTRAALSQLTEEEKNNTFGRRG